MNYFSKITLTAALALGTFSATSAFGAINDWDTDSDDDYSFAPASRSSQSTKSYDGSTGSYDYYDSGRNLYRGWNFSVSGFYAISNDEYVRGVSDSKVDIGGLAFQVNKEFYFGRAPVAFDLGLIAMIGIGESTLDNTTLYTDLRSRYGYWEPDLYVVDAMEGITLGLKFNINDRVWLGFGAMLGFDYRYAELDDGYYDDDDADVGYFYGVYGTGNFRLTDHFGITVSLRWLQTCVEFEDDLEGAEKDIGYFAFQAGVVWLW